MPLTNLQRKEMKNSQREEMKKQREIIEYLKRPQRTRLRTPVNKGGVPGPNPLGMIVGKGFKNFVRTVGVPIRGVNRTGPGSGHIAHRTVLGPRSVFPSKSKQ